MRGFSTAIGAVMSAAVAAALSIAGTAAAEPPGIPSADSARGMLNALTVADEGSMSGRRTPDTAAPTRGCGSR
ncbi:hypothetical protein [Nocardia thraciensis]